MPTLKQVHKVTDEKECSYCNYDSSEFPEGTKEVDLTGEYDLIEDGYSGYIVSIQATVYTDEPTRLLWKVEDMVNGGLDAGHGPSHLFECKVIYQDREEPS